MSQNNEYFASYGIAPLTDLETVYSETGSFLQAWGRLANFYGLRYPDIQVLACLAHYHDHKGGIPAARLMEFYKKEKDEEEAIFMMLDLQALGYIRSSNGTINEIKLSQCWLTDEAWSAFQEGRRIQLEDMKKEENDDWCYDEDEDEDDWLPVFFAKPEEKNHTFHIAIDMDLVDFLRDVQLKSITDEGLSVIELHLAEEKGAASYREAVSALGVDALPREVRQAFWILVASFVKNFTSPLAFKRGEMKAEDGYTECPSVKRGICKLVEKGLAISLPIEQDENTDETDRFVLSPKAAGLLFKGKTELMSYDTLAKYGSIIKADDIEEKKLFFPEATNEIINNIRTMLSAERFEKACHLLIKKHRNPAIHLLLWGPPGTGKTEIVKQLARQSGRDIILVDVSKMTGSLWGETEKAYRGLFLAYEYFARIVPNVPILLMNEADSILAKRLESVTRAIDRSENAVSNILLQGIEDMSGILLATTNLVGNLDPAFERRFLFKAEVPNPDKYAREQIWLSLVPELSAAEAQDLANRFEMSGAQIANVIAKRDLAELYYDGDRGLAYIAKLCEEELAAARERKGRRTRIGF